MKSFKLKLLPPEGFEWKEFKKMIRDASYQCSLVKNRYMTEIGIRILQVKKGDRDIKWVNKNPPKHEKDNGNWTIYKEVHQELINDSKENDPIISLTLAASNERAAKKAFSKSSSSEFWKNQRSLPTYNNSSSINLFFSSEDQGTGGSSLAYWFVKKDGRHYVRIRMWSGSNPFKGCDTIDIPLTFGQRDTSAQKILERVMSGEYKGGAATLKLYKNHDVFLNCSYDHIQKPEEKREVISGRCMGIDLGINHIAAWKLNQTIKNGKKEYIPTGIIHRGIAERIKTHREYIKNKKRAYGFVCRNGFARNGHGRKNATRSLDKISGKQRNFVKTINHQISSELIKRALRFGVETIKMEDLSGIRDTSDMPKKWLAEWPYYELQTMIEYKAMDRQIQVIYIDPAYTSKTCSNCGYVYKEFKTEKEFICPKCGHKEHRDTNAAGNIAKSNKPPKKRNKSKNKEIKESQDKDINKIAC